MIGIGKPKAMRSTLISTVFQNTRATSCCSNSRLKCLRPTQGLNRMPWWTSYSLKASTAP